MKCILRTFFAVACLLTVLIGCGCSGGNTYTIPAPTGPVVQQTDPPTTLPPTTVAPTTVPDPTQPEPDSGITEITMTFVGDCTLGRNHLHTYDKSFDAVYAEQGPDYFLEKVRHIFEEDDVTVVNLEGPLTTSTNIQASKVYCHKGDPAYVSILTGASVEVATLGNNHLMDYGKAGADETVQVLKDVGIGYCYDNIVYLVHEVKGVKIGFVSVNEFYYGSQVEAWLEEGYDYLRNQQGCALAVACMHWGGDKLTYLESDQITLGHELIDMGYDLVVGHHPHVLQAMELYKDRPICYSLGNFCYGGSKFPDDKDSGIFQQTFTFRDSQLVRDTNFRFIPCEISGNAEVNDYQPRIAEGEDAARIIQKINGYSAKYGFQLDADGRPATT